MGSDFLFDRVGAVLFVELGVQASLLLGRAPDNDIVLSDPTVSRHHANVAVEQGQVWVCDLSSTNGTYLNGTRIHGEVMVMPGDELCLGPGVRIQLCLSQQALIA